MAHLTQTFTLKLETQMRHVAENAYSALAVDAWWTKIAGTTKITTATEIVHASLETAQLGRMGKKGGQTKYTELSDVKFEVSTEFVNDSFKINRGELLDESNSGLLPGINKAVNWAQQIAAQIAYWPQQEVSRFIKDPNSKSLITGQNFFATTHPVNPYNPDFGTYANLMTGAAVGAYPGAIVISGVADDVALANLTKLAAYIANLKQANGKQPRNLRVGGLLCPTTVFYRLVHLLNSKLIQTTEYTALQNALGYGEIIHAPELNAAFENGSDTDFYLLTRSPLDAAGYEAGVVYVEREPVVIQYHDGMSDVELARKHELEWRADGRNSVCGTWPYRMIKVRQS